MQASRLIVYLVIIIEACDDTKLHSMGTRVLFEIICSSEQNPMHIIFDIAG